MTQKTPAHTPVADRGTCLLVFVKYPEPGQVKSRLAEAIGEERACSIYRRMVELLVARLRAAEQPFRICFSPEKPESAFQQWLGAGLEFRPQRGTQLGERMYNAFSEAFEENFSRLVLIGSDIPGLSNVMLAEACASLSNFPAVIGPTFDGGYCLIGFGKKTFSPEVFEGIRWGTRLVFESTMKLFARKGICVHVLPLLRDIDTYKDLEQAATEFCDGDYSALFSV